MMGSMSTLPRLTVSLRWPASYPTGRRATTRDRAGRRHIGEKMASLWLRNKPDRAKIARPGGSAERNRLGRMVLRFEKADQIDGRQRRCHVVGQWMAVDRVALEQGLVEYHLDRRAMVVDDSKWRVCARDHAEIDKEGFWDLVNGASSTNEGYFAEWDVPPPPPPFPLSGG